MKHIFKFFLATLVFSVCGFMSAAAQSNSDQKKRPSREEFAQMQANHIAQKLNLNDEKTKKFVDAYGNYQKEFWTIGPRHKRSKDNVTDEDIDKQMTERFAIAEKMNALRRKYYDIYKTFLTPKQIQQVYHEEHAMMQRFSRNGKGAPKAPKCGKRPHKKCDKNCDKKCAKKCDKKKD